MSRRNSPLFAALALGAILSTTGGCDGHADAPAAEPEPVSEVVADAAKDGKEGPQAPVADRMIIRTARLELRADTPSGVASRVMSLAEGVGGFVAHSESSGLDTDIDRVQLRLRVPADRFDSVMASVRGEGEVLTEAVTGEDVTDAYTDLSARLRSQRALEERLLGIMRQAEAVTDLLEVEQHLTRVQTEIEQIEGRKQLLENQVQYATIEVAVASPAWHDPRSRDNTAEELGEAVDDAYELAVACLGGLIRIVGFMLPLFLFGAPIIYAGRRAWKIRQAKARARFVPPPTHPNA